jgi:hypothetical protein
MDQEAEVATCVDWKSVGGGETVKGESREVKGERIVVEY